MCYNYSSAGAYFVTICISDRKQILSEVVKRNFTATDKITDFTVGEGFVPPEDPPLKNGLIYDIISSMNSILSNREDCI